MSHKKRVLIRKKHMFVREINARAEVYTRASTTPRKATCRRRICGRVHALFRQDFRDLSGRHRVSVHIQVGDYFGELALLTGEPRAASVIAKGYCKVATLDRRSFKRLLGSVEEILKRKAQEYKKGPE